MNELYGLLKIQKKEYIEDFQKGNLYFSRLSKFSEKDDSERFDRSESIIYNSDREFKIMYGEDLIGLTKKVEVFSSRDDVKICSLFGLIKKKYEAQNDSELTDFFRVKQLTSDEIGDYACLVTNVDEFVSRLEKINLSKLGCRKIVAKLVTYTDRCLNTLNPDDYVFTKQSKYSHQNEFRIALYEEESSRRDIKVNINGINNISIVCPVSEYNKKIRVRK